MRRCITHVLLLLLGGAIANVAVAWGCVAAHPKAQFSPRYYHNTSGKHPLVIAMIEMSGYRIVTGVDRSGTLLDRNPELVNQYRANVWWPDEAVEAFHGNFAVASGWPSLALTSWRTMWGEDEMAYPSVIHQGILLHSLSGSDAPTAIEVFPAILALQPLWPGFAVNTIFYAAVLWMMFVAPGIVKRILRRKRGLCAACAYPIGTSPVCTECGKPVKVRAGMGLPPPATPARESERTG